MVRWLSPKFLIGAGIELLVSGAFSELLDKRELAAGLPGYGEDLDAEAAPLEPFKSSAYRDEDGALWLDYVADIGEGFDPTYTVAWCISRPALELEPGLVTKRGRVLVLGGDQVYPSASWEDYRDRFVGPYKAALPHLPEDEVPHLFAIPGNHDWYDGLTSFTRLFTQRSWIGAWRTRQRRSYFAVRLSKRWWLWGIDIQFDTYLDGPQLEYFRAASEDLLPGDQVILATAKPSWVRAERNREPQLKKEGAWQTLAFVEEKLIGESDGELALTLTGDHHFYARYEKEDGEGPIHRITAGGGGAHSMGTASLPKRISPPSLDDPDVSATYSLRATSPTREESIRIRDGIVGAVMRVRLLGFFLGGLYALIALAFADAVKDHATGMAPVGGDPSVWRALWDGGSTWSIGLALSLLAGLVAFANVKRKPALKVIAGATHWFIHLILALAVPVALIVLLGDERIADHGMLLGWLGALGAFLVGSVAGLLTFGVYLLLMNRSSPGRHMGEVWGGLASSEFKNFVRMRIDDHERLTVYPVGVSRSVPWRLDPEGEPEDPWFAPADGPPQPRLIEPPILIDP